MRPLSSRNLRRLGVAAAVVATLMAGVGLWRGRAIAPAPAHAFVAPPRESVPALEACWVEYARNDAWGQVASAGLTRAARWDITVSGVLVRHPRGDVVIDVGNSAHFPEEIAGYGFFSRLFLAEIPGSNRPVHTAPEALRLAGADPSALLGVILSHAHVDHAGGLVDLPGVPVWIPEEEIAFFADNVDGRTVDVVPAHARAVAGRTRALRFDSGPYETFDVSADVFGDGSLVVVPLFGHTPGSVGTFVNVSPSLRIFHVGDAVNVLDAVERRVTKSVVMRFTDRDPAAADATVARLAELSARDPQLAILPAHDRGAWQRVFGAKPGCVSR